MESTIFVIVAMLSLAACGAALVDRRRSTLHLLGIEFA